MIDENILNPNFWNGIQWKIVEILPCHFKAWFRQARLSDIYWKEDLSNDIYYSFQYICTDTILQRTFISEKIDRTKWIYELNSPVKIFIYPDWENYEIDFSGNFPMSYETFIRSKAALKIESQYPYNFFNQEDKKILSLNKLTNFSLSLKQQIFLLLVIIVLCVALIIAGWMEYINKAYIIFWIPLIPVLVGLLIAKLIEIIFSNKSNTP